jgi:hypothetical protein
MAKVNLDTASRLDIVCRKGDSFSLSINFNTELSATASYWTMKVAETDESGNFALTLNDAENFTIENNADGMTNALMNITVPGATMAGVTAGNYVYDLQFNNGVLVKTYLYGTFLVNEDVS